MDRFFFILTRVVLPIFLLIGIGYFAGKVVKAKSETLVTLQFYFFIPALIFVKLYEFGVTGILLVTIHSILLFIILYIFAFFVAKLRRFQFDKRQAFINSICYYNSGNYCIPLIETLYTDPIAISTQIIVMVTQNIITCTAGVFSSAGGKLKNCILEVLKLPLIYAAILGCLFNVMNFTIYAPLYSVLEILSETMVPVALITLGIQLSAVVSGKEDIMDVALASSVRLVVSPLLSFAIALALGIKGIALQVLIISAAAPTAVNAVLLAIKYKKAPEFSSKIAMLTTVFSAFTVSIVILLVSIYL